MRGLGLLVVALGCAPSAAQADEEPRQWEQLFFPFPIVGAPPQLEQQVQIFDSLFTGARGKGDVLQAELAYIASPHLGFVLSVPYQFGFQGQPDGFGDIQLLAQYLAAGSLKYDNMLSMGLQGNFPTGQHNLGSGDFYFGPFIYGAQRLFHRLIFEANATALLPVVHGESVRQISLMGLVAVLLTPVKLDFPVYVQLETDAAFYLDGTSGLPPLETHSPAATVFMAPEVFLGPFRSPISSGTRVAAGVFFNVTGDAVHERTYTITLAFDIPNRYGY